MRWNSFSRGLLFSAIAAAAYGPFTLVAGPLLGARDAQSLYGVGLCAIYLAGLARPGAARLGVAALAGALGLVAAALVTSTGELALSLGALIGAVRSGLLYRARPLRAILTEVALALGGLLFARFLLGPSAIAVMLAIWGYFLVQSTFFLIPGTKHGRSRASGPDPFELAHARALALLDEQPV
jgi:hypothetical protein